MATKRYSVSNIADPKFPFAVLDSRKVVFVHYYRDRHEANVRADQLNARAA